QGKRQQMRQPCQAESSVAEDRDRIAILPFNSVEVVFANVAVLCEQLIRVAGKLFVFTSENRIVERGKGMPIPLIGQRVTGPDAMTVDIPGANVLAGVVWLFDLPV